MEKRHKQRLHDRFGELLIGQRLIILDVEDNYPYMDNELIETLKIVSRHTFDIHQLEAAETKRSTPIWKYQPDFLYSYRSHSDAV